MSTPTVADPAAGLCAYLSTAIGDLLDDVPAGHGMTGPALFRPTLPEWADASMPLASIVIRPAGGYKMFGAGLLPVADPVLDLVCYAGAQQQAYLIAAAAARALKQLTVGIYDGTKLYWAKVAGGPIPLPDQQTLWPACWLGTQVMHAETADSPS